MTRPIVLLAWSLTLASFAMPPHDSGLPAR